jgi:hypothetical protein
MEFWPYAIKRSGVSKPQFIELVTELFGGYFEYQGSSYRYYDISEMDAFFDLHDGPEKGSTVVMVNR